MIDNQNWNQYCHKYCDSIEMINPSFDIDRCHDEINFEEKYNIAENYYNRDKNFCAIDIANEILYYNVGETMKNRARDLISDCKDRAIITVGVSVDNNYLSDDLDSYLINQLQNYKEDYSFYDYLEIKNNSYADYTLDLTIDNFNYDSGWDETETKYACVIYTRNDERYRTIIYEEQKWETVNGQEYYVVLAGGQEYYIKDVGGIMQYLGEDGLLHPFTLYYENVMIEKTRKEKYTVKQYKYHKVTYKAKYGKEEMNFSTKIELKDNSGNYLKYSRNKNLSYNEDYIKYDMYGSYDINELVECPNIMLDEWTDDYYNCDYINTTYFDASSDPFKGKNEFYQYYLKKDVRSFVKLHIPKIMENIKQKHIDMQCD